MKLDRDTLLWVRNYVKKNHASRRHKPFGLYNTHAQQIVDKLDKLLGKKPFEEDGYLRNRKKR